MNITDLSIWIAFSAGILSFFSSCVLPLYPAYLSYISGISVDRLKQDFNKKEERNRTLLHTLFFISGFSIVFIAMGYGASFVGNFFYEFQNSVRQIGAIIMIFMGFILTGWIKIQWLMQEKRLEIKNKPTGYLGSSLIGISFAAGWTPWVGPILAIILSLAATNPSSGVLYLILYSVGFAIPFFVMAFFIGSTKWIQKYSHKMMKIGGVLLIISGGLLFTNEMAKITLYLTKWFGVNWFY